MLAVTPGGQPDRKPLVRLSILYAVLAFILDSMTSPRRLDRLDRRLLTLLERQPDVGVLGASRELGVARGTVQARLDRLVRDGVIRSFAPTIDPTALGYPVTAFCTVEIRQGQGHGPVVDHLSAIPEVLEAHTITGSGDLVLRIVARDNADLQRVLDAILGDEHVTRANTLIALAERIRYRTGPLVASTGA